MNHGCVLLICKIFRAEICQQFIASDWFVLRDPVLSWSESKSRGSSQFNPSSAVQSGIRHKAKTHPYIPELRISSGARSLEREINLGSVSVLRPCRLGYVHDYAGLGFFYCAWQFEHSKRTQVSNNACYLGDLEGTQRQCLPISFHAARPPEQIISRIKDEVSNWIMAGAKQLGNQVERSSENSLALLICLIVEG